MNSAVLFFLVILYLGVLFFIASAAERSKNPFWLNSPYVYSQSLAVYCSAWTYYRSIGVAANSGLEYLAIYLGPVIIIPAWVYINKKIVRISRVNKISSLADFLSLRYRNSRLLGAMVAVLCLVVITPYIGLQIKAISETFHLITNTTESKNIFFDTATYVVVIIALFCSNYGTRYVDASEKHPGIIAAEAGYEVFVARDGSEVLEILKTEIPDLILLDIMMPQVDGYSTLSEIRKNDNLKDIKVIFLSAKTGDADIEKGLSLGADAYVTKPYSIKKLTEKVENLLK